MAEDRRRIINDLNELENENLRILREKASVIQDELRSAELAYNTRLRAARQEEYMRTLAEISAELEREALNRRREGYELSENVTDELELQNRLYGDINRQQNKFNKVLSTISASFKNINGLVKLTWDYLMQSDKVIRQTILNLGMSGAKAEIMRESFEASAQFVARLGGNLGDIQTIMEAFANETGRARALSEEMVKDTFLIGKGTGLGVEQGAKLAAQFELMGVDAKAAMEYAQGVVETSELMGVNTTKVLKNINDNFSKLQKYTFAKGVQGFAKMAEYAEKFHMDMSQSLDAAQTARSLEGAVDLAAQLQVMGGQFAATDPFQMLYAARNAPDEFQKQINEMTKGIATFRQKADGTFENFISPADIDRLTQVEKALGLQSGELIKQSRRMAEIQKMRQSMVGMGLSDNEKTLIEGMAKFQTNTGRFTVQIGEANKYISELSKEDLKILQRRSASLEERAKQAQTFDDVFKATIEELKATLLPMLKGVNLVLEKVRPVVIKITDWIGQMAENKEGWLKIAGVLLGAGAVWKGVAAALGGVTKGLTQGIAGRVSGRIGGAGARGTAGRAVSRGAAGGGGKALGAGVGVGVAAAGIGGGIALAAEGLSALADSLSKLTPEQAKTLETIATTLAITFPLAAIGIAIVAAVAAPAAVPLLALGAAMLMIGGAIGIAAAGIGVMTMGIGKMAEGFGTLITQAKGAGPELFSIAAGIGAIGLALATMSIGAFGLPVFAATLALIGRGKKVENIERIGKAFGNINAVLKGSGSELNRVRKAIKEISQADLSNLKAFKGLSNVLGNGALKVEFTDKEVAMVSNITLLIDGEKFVERLSIPERVAITQKRQRQGSTSSYI